MKLQMLGLAAVGAAGLYTYDQYDKKANYTPVQARLTTVDEQCFLKKEERNVVTKTTYTSKVGPCDAAEVALKTMTQWQGGRVVHKIQVQFSFVSPVDGKTHNSNQEFETWPANKPLHAGDVMPVLASKTEGDKTRQI